MRDIFTGPSKKRKKLDRKSLQVIDTDELVDRVASQFFEKEAAKDGSETLLLIVRGEEVLGVSDDLKFINPKHWKKHLHQPFDVYLAPAVPMDLAEKLIDFNHAGPFSPYRNGKEAWKAVRRFLSRKPVKSHRP
jgi:hypothetical protein